MFKLSHDFVGMIKNQKSICPLQLNVILTFEGEGVSDFTFFDFLCQKLESVGLSEIVLE